MTFADLIWIKQMKFDPPVIRLRPVECFAEVEGGTKLEACLADFGLSAVLPGPKENVNSKLL